jgi:hypothetical protein
MMLRFGYDYGIRPMAIVVGDTEFLRFLGSREFVALAYDQITEFGLLINPPRLTLVFSNTEVARECFRHFNEWSGDSSDGDAVRISFIEFNDGGYGICISQEVNRLIGRMIPDIIREEVELRIMNSGRMKTFPRQSEAYKWFKSVTEKSPFVLAPAVTGEDPIRELAIRKREIYYFQEGDIPEHSLESSLLRGRDIKEAEERIRDIPDEVRFGRDGIHNRRRRQLSRFFPVTIERLSLNKDFLQTKSQLSSEGYQEWQVVQAACNIALRHSAPGLFTPDVDTADDLDIPDDQDDVHTRRVTLRILQFLLANHESVVRVLPPNEQLLISAMKAQIQADSYVLLKHVTESNCKGLKPAELQGALETHRLLISGNQ